MCCRAATGQKLQNQGWSQGPLCHFVFRQLNNCSCKGTAWQVPNMQPLLLNASLGRWVGPQHTTAAHLQKVTAPCFLNFFPRIFVAKLLLWQNHRFLSPPSWSPAPDQFPMHVFLQISFSCLALFTPCSTWACSPKSLSTSWMLYIIGLREYVCWAIIESLRLETNTKIAKSNYSPIATTSTDHVPHCHISTVLEHLQGQWLHYFPGQLCQCITTLFEKKFYLISNFNLSWCNLRPSPLDKLASTFLHPFLQQHTNTPCTDQEKKPSHTLTSHFGVNYNLLLGLTTACKTLTIPQPKSFAFF